MSLLKRITGAAGLAPEGEPGSWVSDAAREKFLAAYERAFALWPQPCEEFDVETATATTRVHAYRPHPGGDPVVLLSAFNTAGLYPHVAALAEGGPVYGIDMPGEANPSVPRALITPPEHCAAWLDELLGKLSDHPAHLVGFSYGSWIAMNQAIRAPGRGRVHHAARPRRAHQARRPLLALALHQRPGHPDPDAAAPSPRPVARQPCGGRHCSRQPRRLQPDRRTEQPDCRLHQSPGHRQASGSAHGRRQLNGRTGNPHLIDKGFAEHSIDRVVAETMTVNLASRRVMEKCGLTYVRTFVEHEQYAVDGADQGHVEYQLTRADWEAARSGRASVS